MTKSLLMDKYPIVSTTINKESTNCKNVSDFLNYFKNKIENDPVAKFITTFSNYEHTSSLEVGEINGEIIDAQIVIFCFGPKIPNPQILAVRPRSIAVVETKANFVISFMEAPNEMMSEKMENWVKEIIS